MRGFLIAWVVAFGLVALAASSIGWFVGASPPPPTPVARPGISSVESDGPAAPFLETDAVEVVARTLRSDASGDEDRRRLQASATVTYHSPQHWRVCFDGACWVAHGPGRYAEAENEAARQREAPGRSTP